MLGVFLCSLCSKVPGLGRTVRLGYPGARPQCILISDSRAPSVGIYVFSCDIALTFLAVYAVLFVQLIALATWMGYKRCPGRVKPSRQRHGRSESQGQGLVSLSSWKRLICAFLAGLGGEIVSGFGVQSQLNST